MVTVLMGRGMVLENCTHAWYTHGEPYMCWGDYSLF